VTGLDIGQAQNASREAIGNKFNKINSLSHSAAARFAGHSGSANPHRPGIASREAIRKIFNIINMINVTVSTQHGGWIAAAATQ
jgi:hypothetical protein